ncbi:DegV family protein [Anaerotalea alkaliphila]|uniref:DegV family protein n=1 Tax=Anaerotalea alkaliphila TaxID=2662126 RepID=A0A7X5HUW4_9FIRM|nr:DegV family protein [Anaerotalea alkaliphila]NDL67115.1 DegV family protein [Anaerotalea alkaliphila]
MAIQLVIDSSADVPRNLVDRYGITVCPLSVHFGEEEYLDGVDLGPKEFYEKLVAGKGMPKTSQVTPERFKEAFLAAADAGKEVLCITIGSKASGTCQSANIAKAEVEEERPEAAIAILDSNMLCMGQGYLAVLAARYIQEGWDMERILAQLEPLTQNRIEHLFSVDTLEYLKRGGRIKPAAALVADVLNIKPVLRVVDATTETIGKVRGRKKVIPFFLEHMRKTFDPEANSFIAIAHAQDREFAEALADAVKETFQWEKEIIFAEVGATIGTHTGPGVVGIFYLKK